MITCATTLSTCRIDWRDQMCVLYFSASAATFSASTALSCACVSSSGAFAPLTTMLYLRIKARISSSFSSCILSSFVRSSLICENKQDSGHADRNSISWVSHYCVYHWNGLKHVRSQVDLRICICIVRAWGFPSCSAANYQNTDSSQAIAQWGSNTCWEEAMKRTKWMASQTSRPEFQHDGCFDSLTDLSSCPCRLVWIWSPSRTGPSSHFSLSLTTLLLVTLQLCYSRLVNLNISAFLPKRIAPAQYMHHVWGKDSVNWIISISNWSEFQWLIWTWSKLTGIHPSKPNWGYCGSSKLMNLTFSDWNSFKYGPVRAHHWNRLKHARNQVDLRLCICIVRAWGFPSCSAANYQNTDSSQAIAQWGNNVRRVNQQWKIRGGAENIWDKAGLIMWNATHVRNVLLHRWQHLAHIPFDKHTPDLEPDIKLAGQGTQWMHTRRQHFLLASNFDIVFTHILHI